MLAFPGCALPPPAEPAPVSRADYLAACVEVELLEQELRSLETALNAAYDRLAATEPNAHRIASIRQIQERSALQFEVLLRLTRTVTDSDEPPAPEIA